MDLPYHYFENLVGQVNRINSKMMYISPGEPCVRGCGAERGRGGGGGAAARRGREGRQARPRQGLVS